MIVLELEVIKETPQKRITLVRELDKRNIYIKKELKTYNKTIWEKLKQLGIEGIPHIYSIEENEDGLEIIEEYLACQTLSDILDEHIFYDGKQVYLFDFDIARNYIENQKRDTTVLGSQGYAAPEQFGFYQTDIRSDIYSLGVLYHVLLTNKLPRDYDLQGIEKRIIDKMIAIDPQGRYQDVKEIIKDLDQLFHIEKKKEKKIKHPNALPGFRSGKLWKMIVAIMGYLLFIWILISFKIENQPISQYQYFVYRLILISWFIITLLFSTNYLSVRGYLPYYKNHGIAVKVLTTIISWLILLFISIIIGTLLMYL